MSKSIKTILEFWSDHWLISNDRMRTDRSRKMRSGQFEKLLLLALTIRPKIPEEFAEISMGKWYSLFSSVEDDNCSLEYFNDF